MKKSTIIQIIIGILFAIAIALGLLQRNNQPELDKPNAVNDQSNSQELSQYYQKGQDLKSQQEQKTTITFLAVGDIMLSRNVAAEIQKKNDPLAPFRTMEGILKSTDFNFGNLESPFAETNPIIGGHSLIFGAPKGNLQGLTGYNFKIVNLANNHGLDQGYKGLLYTQELLHQSGIYYVGTGSSLDKAWEPAVLDMKGLKICFVGASYASINDSGKTTNNYVARIEDIEMLKPKILNLKSDCDFIIATMHAGTEYTRTPNQAQVTFAHAALDAGADMVIGAHPHWVQTIEKYCPPPATLQTSPPLGEMPPQVTEKVQCTNPKYIFYSLGNFIFDQEWSQETKEGLTLKIQISKNQISNLQGPHVPASLESIELIPVVIENYSTPRPANEQESTKILEKIGQSSWKLK